MHEQIFNAFEFTQENSIERIYPYAPVYKIQTQSAQYVIKQTRSDLRESQHIASFLKQLANHNLPIVSPATLASTNPKLVGDDVWVVYPFIEGEKYTGKPEQILAAGQLLGKIHAHSSSDNHEKLGEYDAFDFESNEIESDFSTIKEQLLATQSMIDTPYFDSLLKQTLLTQTDLKGIPLPKTATPYDYKADNLVYLNSTTPYLIDPDNALFLPRIFDLALALLLFHNVLDTAPNHVWTPSEWQLFLEGYTQSVTLTSLEKSTWVKAVQHIFMDEVLWLLSDFDEGWQNEHQRALYTSIFNTMQQLNNYPI